MSKLKIFLISLAIVIVLATGSLIAYYLINLTAPSAISEEALFVVKAGSSKTKVVENLAAEGLIKNEKCALIYLKLNPDIVIQAGNYILNRNQSVAQIMATFSSGKVVNNAIKITFVEGKRLTCYLDLIAHSFNFSKAEILTKINDQKYLQSLIDRYWFLTPEILDADVYFGLEGYLFPDTYQFFNDSTIEDIITKMLDNTNRKLTPYKEIIQSSGYTVHQILTMASIIELEAVTAEDRATVSQVIRSRIKSNMPLGMDVTTYYAVQKDMSEALTAADFATVSPYNTRDNINMVAKLPIGPICNPSVISIEAALNPSATDYLFFYADLATGKVYFARTEAEFFQLVKELG